jgi:serine/threonine protein kinase
MVSDPLIGQTIGNYEVLHRLGKGGMATVYRARQTNMARDVAIKIMSADLAEDPKFVQRFEREAQVIANLQHPRILPVHDFGHEGELFYLVMRVIDGESLYHRMLQGPLPIMTTAKFVTQIAEALDYAHAQGVIHRDLKPNNVLIDEWDNCYLMDFGLAKMLAATHSLTQTGTVIGTPAYMAPEQWRGESVDARTDVYALGVMLYEMVLGHPPFESDTPFTLMYKHINDPPPRPTALIPDMPDEVEDVILKALAKEREERYQAAGDLAREFTSVARVAGSLVVRERLEDEFDSVSGEPAAAEAVEDEESPRAAGEVARPSGPVDEVAAPDAADVSPDSDAESQAEAVVDVSAPADSSTAPEKVHAATDTPVPFPLPDELIEPPSHIAPPPPPIPLPDQPRRAGARRRRRAPASSESPQADSRIQRALEAVDHSIEAVAEKAIMAAPALGADHAGTRDHDAYGEGALVSGEPPASAVPVNVAAFDDVRSLVPAHDPVVGVLDVRGTAQWKTWKYLLVGGIVLFFFGGMVGAGFFSLLGLILLGYLGLEVFRTYRGDIGRYYLGFTPQRVIVLPRASSGEPLNDDAWVVAWEMVRRLRLTDRYVLLDLAADDVTLSFGALLLPHGDGGLGDQLRWLPDSPVADLIADQGFETRNL